MKTTFFKSVLSATIFCAAFAACESALDIEPKYKENYLSSEKTPEYYQNLREYKKSDHAITFGWFGNWNGVGASLSNCMAGIPDSVDVISMWGGWRTPTAKHIEDLRYVQQVKGTKALVVFIVQNIGDQLTPTEYKDDQSVKAFWGWKDGDQESIEAAIRKYANAICDTIDKYDYDGFDLDYEPNYGHSGSLGGKNDRMSIWCDEMSKRVGPKSGTGRLFVVDGEPQSMPAETGPLFDYFIVQAYQSSGYWDLDSRLNSTINNYAGVLTPEEVARKYVVTENFESYSAAGGVRHQTRDGRYVQSLEGMAIWNPILDGKVVRKGGVGTYHMEYEFTIPGLSGTYPYLRKATQIMNPSIK